MCQKSHRILGQEERGKTHHILDLLVRKNPASLSQPMSSGRSKKAALLRAVKIKRYLRKYLLTSLGDPNTLSTGSAASSLSRFRAKASALGSREAYTGG